MIRTRNTLAVAAFTTILLLSVLIVAGCSSNSSGSSRGPIALNRGGICWRYHQGEAFTEGGTLTNSTQYPISVMSASLTGVRDMKLDSVYGYVIHGDAVLDEYGWPPKSQRHAVRGTVVPARASAQLLYVVTAFGSDAYAAGNVVR